MRTVCTASAASQAAGAANAGRRENALFNRPLRLGNVVKIIIDDTPRSPWNALTSTFSFEAGFGIQPMGPGGPECGC